MTLQQKRIVPKPLPKIKEYGPNAIEVKDLTFGYSSTGALDKFDERNVLKNLNLTLKTGSRCLLIGANGSGKSTLLRILAGRNLTQQEVKVLGLNSFRDTKLNFHRAYLNCDWGMTSIAFVGASVPLCADIPVYKMMVGSERMSKQDARNSILSEIHFFVCLTLSPCLLYTSPSPRDS